jgi:hypothetical protein
MKLGIINTAFAQAGVDTAIGLKHIARIGFDTVDIFTEIDGSVSIELEYMSVGHSVSPKAPGTARPLSMCWWRLLCPLPTAYCLLRTAYCVLPTAYCLLRTAYCVLPTFLVAPGRR